MGHRIATVEHLEARKLFANAVSTPAPDIVELVREGQRFKVVKDQWVITLSSEFAKSGTDGKAEISNAVSIDGLGGELAAQPSSELSDLLARSGNGLVFDRYLGSADTFQLSAPGKTYDDLVADFKSSPEVVSIEPNMVWELAGAAPSEIADPNNPNGSNQYWYNKLDMMNAWDFTKGSANGVVALLDTGVDRNHEDLSANVYKNASGTATGFNATTTAGTVFVTGTSNESHGTQVTGVLAAAANGKGIVGVNQLGKYYPVRVTTHNSDDTESAIYSAIVAGIGHVNALYDSGVNVRVINACVAGKNWPQDGNTISSQTALSTKIDQAKDRGILFVAAAYNFDENLDTLPSAHNWYPAALTNPNVITVGATQSNDQLAQFVGTYGQSGYRATNYGLASVDLAAPGKDIKTTNVDGGYLDNVWGTSMATPMVSGAISLALAIKPDLTYQEIRNTLLSASSLDQLPADTRSPTRQIAGATSSSAGRRLNVNKFLTNITNSAITPYNYKNVVLGDTGGNPTNDVFYVDKVGSFVKVTKPNGTVLLSIPNPAAGDPPDSIAIFGLAGDDHILVRDDPADGTDNINVAVYINGGRGNDEIHGSQNSDTLLGEDGNDSIYGFNAFDKIYGGNGNDRIYGDDGVTATTGNDSLFGGEGNDTLYGNNGNDVLRGEGGADYLYGEGGNDTLRSADSSALDRVYGGSGTDYSRVSLGERDSGDWYEVATVEFYA